jgi:hypothetical protein
MKNERTVRDYIIPIQEREQRVSAIATEYLSLSPEEQINTLIVSGTNAEKDAIAAEIRAGLKANGTLGESRVIVQLRDRALTPEESREIAYYRVGDYVSLSRQYKSVPLWKDTPYRVMGRAENELVVASPGGRLYRFNPQQCKDKQVYSSHEFEVAVGDSLRWTSSNRRKGQINGDTSKVTAINGQMATVLTKSGVKQIDLGYPLAVDYTLTTTSYRAQGSDRPRVFVSATNDPTSNREPFYVSISRQIKELKVWTEDYEGLTRRVAESSGQRNPLELLGENHGNNGDASSAAGDRPDESKLRNLSESVPSHPTAESGSANEHQGAIEYDPIGDEADSQRLSSRETPSMF